MVRMVNMRLYLALALFVVTAGTAVAGAPLDGAVVRQSASTNTQPVEIRLWSNGHAQVAVGMQDRREFTVPVDVANKFFQDVRAARTNPGTQRPCMKSVSFGTTTHVTWHEYTSWDLQCRPLSPAVAVLADDVEQIMGLANVGSTVRNRIPNPNYIKRAPVEGPVTPAPKATP
jgi:hypothetical protein